MFAWIISAIVPGLADDALKALFSFISNELEKRNLIAQGKAQQYTADLAATVKDSTNAAQIRGQVQGESDSQLNADLNSLRQSTPSHK